MKAVANIFIFVAVALNCSAQDTSKWAPVGARWYYDKPEFTQPQKYYITIDSEKDSLFKGKQCRMLTERIQEGTYSSSVSGIYHFMYYDSGRVFHYHQKLDTFYILYDFSILPGQYWTTIAPDTIWGGNNVKIFVDSTGWLIANNNDSLKIQYVHTDSSSSWGRVWRVIETIGMEPIFLQLKVMDPPGYGGLRCYSEKGVAIYKSPHINTCEYIVSIKEYDSVKYPFSVAYSALDQQIIILSDDHSTLSLIVYNALGEKVFNEELTIQKGERQLVNFPHLSPGVYFIKLDDNHANMSVKKVVFLSNH